MKIEFFYENLKKNTYGRSRAELKIKETIIFE